MPTATRTCTVRNDVPRRTVDGAIVDCHEPCLRRFGDRFYFYGTNYRCHSGFTPDNLIVCSSSEDLEYWHDHGPMLPRFDQGLTVAPDVLFNARTGRYVMWIVQGGRYTVATAPEPAGPFTVETRAAEIAFPEAGCGDFALAQDADGSAYLIATRNFKHEDPSRKHGIVVERLDDDYRSGTGELSDWLGWNCEAPVLFERDGLWYACFDTTCCYCEPGTGIQVHTGPTPLGPFTYRGNCNRDLACDVREIDSPSTAPGSGRPDCIVDAQQRRVEWVETAQGRELIWIGDRWGSADDGVKGHDYTYWTPLAFAADGMIERFEWRDRWSIALR